MRLNKRLKIIILGAFFLVAMIFARLFLISIYRVPILMYHSIGYASDTNNRMTVSPQVFEKQMRYLRRSGYNIVPLEKAVRYIAERKRPPDKTIAITLDDGYKDNYTNAYPVLKKYNVPATIFIVIKLVGREGFVDWADIKEMSDSGIADIESHTVSHLWLTGLTDDDLKRELVNSKDILERRLGKDVNFLCYPMGGYDERVKSAVRDAGYRAAFATKPTRLHPNYDLYEIKRIRISPSADNLFVFNIKVSGYHAFLRLIQDDYKNIPDIWKSTPPVQQNTEKEVEKKDTGS